MAETVDNQYLTARKGILKKKFSGMNPMQQEAIFQVEGPLLILAGAGSGKTTVLVNRIANMVQFGDAYNSTTVPANAENYLEFLDGFLNREESESQEISKVEEGQVQTMIACKPIKPWNILAITFTNKAAGELKERLETILGDDARDIQASTFHAACMRILRREISVLGYESNFTVYDTDDSLRIIKEALKELGIVEKTVAPKAILSAMSAAKDQFIDPEMMLKESAGDARKETNAKVFAFYQKRLKSANALDFDDIIILTVKIFQQFPDILQKYQNRFRYIMVDEYQDTNNSQFLFVSMLSQEHHNICVVGDDDQSIYKFRGATIENILNFENQYKNAKVIRLEQNYRCSQTILDAANTVIQNNTQRKGKTLWTENETGNLVKVYRGIDEQDEARYIADTILNNVRDGQRFSSHAILYRMNAQSNTIENALIRSGITYRIIGGQRFYDRKEIKDVISYMSVINNHQDTVRLRRVINEPKRGIGDATLEKAQEIAISLGVTLFEILRTSDAYQPLVKKAKVLMEFAMMIERLGQKAEELPMEEFFDALLVETGYKKYLEGLGEEGKTRIENVAELKTNIIKYQNQVAYIPSSGEEGEETKQSLPTLAGFLEEVTLYTDLDNYDPDADNVIMMTMHSAKGLEFDNVFFCGAEEGIFPGMQAMYNPEQIEEERRLAYVCITRAKKQLTITNSAQRMIFGQTVRNRVSRFVTEIPPNCCDVEDKTIRKKAAPQPEEVAAAKKFRSRASNDIGVGTASPSGSPSVAGICKLKVGERVKHRTFGEGVIEKVTQMGGDSLLEVTFDKVGVKKIMYKFAKLTKL